MKPADKSTSATKSTTSTKKEQVATSGDSKQVKEEEVVVSNPLWSFSAENSKMGNAG